MRLMTAAGVIAVFALSACSGEDTTSSADGSNSADDTPSAGSDSDGSSSSAGSAVVMLGATTYEMGVTDGCRILDDGSVLAGFTDGDDMVSLNSAGGVVLVRVTVDGAEWVDGGSPAEPDVADGTVSWSGELFPFDGGSSETASITMTC